MTTIPEHGCASNYDTKNVPARVEEVRRLALRDIAAALEASSELVRSLGEYPDARASVLSARAHVLCYANRFEEAMASLAEAMTAARARGSTPDMAAVSNASVQPLARLGRLAEAEDAARLAADLYERSGATTEAGRAEMNLGVIMRMRGNPGGALIHFERALVRLGSNPSTAGAVENNRAEAMLDMDRFSDARRCFERSLDSFLRAGDHHAAAIVGGNLADLLSRQGHVDEALERFERARRLFEQAGVPGDAARLGIEEAEALASMGAYRAALDRYTKHIPELERASLALEIARAKLGKALLRWKVGNRATAETELREGIDLASAIGGCGLLSQALSVLAGEAILRGDIDTCDSLWKRAIADAADRPARRAACSAELARACIRAGIWERAESLIKEVEAASASARVRPMLACARHLRGQLCRAMGKTVSAMRYFRRAMSHAERQRGTLRAERFRVAYSESWRELYLSSCAASLESETSDGVDEAFYSVERLRARTLADSLVSPATTPGKDRSNGALLREYDDTVGELIALYSRLDGSHGPESLRARLSDLETRCEQLRDRIVATAEARPGLARPLTVEEACAALSDDEAMVSFFPDGDFYGAFVLRSRGRWVVRRVAKIEEVESVLARLEFMAGRWNGEAAWPGTIIPRLTERMHHLLMEPLRAVLGEASRLTIVPWGSLHRVPWAMLDQSGVLLLERASITTAPSVTVGVMLARRWGDRPDVRAGGGRCAFVGVADELAPEVESEVHAAAAAATNAETLVGQDATVEALQDAMRHADVLHLACHCVFSSEHPMSTRVRLWDRWATTRELVGHAKLGGEVVLAGCETARTCGGEDRWGLTRAFLSSGSAAVMAALWPLHDRGASLFFPALHRRLSESDRPGLAKASRDVQLRMKQVGLHPFLWGGLVVTGSTP